MKWPHLKMAEMHPAKAMTPIPIVPIQYPLVLNYCISMHIIWAAMLLWDDSAGNITAMADLYRWFGWALAPILLLISAVAMAPMLHPLRGMIPLACLVPQQIVLTIAAGTAMSAMVNSTFADGVDRPRAFIIADQTPAILAAVFHTLAVIGNYWGSLWGRK